MTDYSNWTLGTPAAMANYNGGGNLGGSGSNYSAPYGGIPGVPNPAATQGNILGGNLSNLSALGNLTTGLTTQSANAAALPYQLNLPQYGAMTGQASNNIMDELQGKLPQDVLNLLGQQGAERGVMTGSPGSPNSNAGYLRALGLTSLDMTNRGNADLTSAIGRTPTGHPFDPASMIVSPDSAQNWQYLANQMAVAPVPSAAAAANMAAVQAGVGQGRGATAPGAGSGVASSRFNTSGMMPPGAINGAYYGTNIQPPAPDFTTQQWMQSLGLSPTSGPTANSYSNSLQELLNQGYTEQDIMAMSPQERQGYVQSAYAPALESGMDSSYDSGGSSDMTGWYE